MRKEFFKLTWRFILLSVFLVGIAGSCIGASPEAIRPAADPQVHSGKDSEITLQVRRIKLFDGTIKALYEHRRIKLPAMNAFTVLGPETTSLLIDIAKGDHVKLADEMPSVTLPDGEVQSFPVYGTKYADTVKAEISNNRLSVEIHFVWAKWEDGKERLPPMTAVIPIGSHLLIHDMMLSGWKPKDSSWVRLTKWIPGRRVDPPIDPQQGFLFITPHIASSSK